MSENKTQGYQFTDDMARMHVHEHTGLTSCNEGHCHIHPGVTGPPIPDGSSHYHQIIGQTTYDRGHYHVYNACSGPAVMLPCGQHTHFASFRTSFNLGHDHMIEGYVKAAPGETHPHKPCYSPYDTGETPGTATQSK
ncbi:YmaF family protein [Desulfallas thermosapovorans]|uniref:YmaF-like protein n=1 Tax=Desulfallas thermosapovorans DSM 6562 TaxID=1121431 RepID=A0A5S4ZVV8_9FIRM|nr:YmaF family protein [Desulfallas thermosapovorans]TYO96936.1 YmaF-like protein [Desulfallas thermosapovorans DSM 6562]